MGASLMCAMCATDTGFVSSQVALSKRVWPVCSSACFRSVIAQKGLLGYTATTPGPGYQAILLGFGADAYITLRDPDGGMCVALLYET